MFVVWGVVLFTLIVYWYTAFPSISGGMLFVVIVVVWGVVLFSLIVYWSLFSLHFCSGMLLLFVVTLL